MEKESKVNTKIIYLRQCLLRQATSQLGTRLINQTEDLIWIEISRQTQRNMGNQVIGMVLKNPKDNGGKR
jgi:hypothetical protein